MDCEKFDKVVLEMLYEELDELTNAAARRHMDQCTRCREIGNGLRATREVGIMPMLETPEGLTRKILDADRNARAALPLRQRVGRAISVMAGYAMRPQLAMAATLLLMIGASLLFLRSRPGDRDNVHVTERGVPEAEGESVAIVPLAEHRSTTESEAIPRGGTREKARRSARAAPGAAAPAPNADEAPVKASRDEKSGDEVADVEDSTRGGVEQQGEDGEYQAALGSYRNGQYDDALRRFDKIAQGGGPKAPSAALHAAQSARISSGCKSAAPRFERVNSAYRGTGVAHEATWQAADCYRVMGQTDLARRNYEALVSVAGYGERAKRALASLGSPSPKPASVASRAKKQAPASKAAAKAKPQPKTEEPKAADPEPEPPAL